VVAWVEGLQSAGVAACLKHYPGHGDTSTDSHLSLPTIDAPLDVLVGRELVPFAAGCAAGAAAVMTSHIVVGALDVDLPATLSPRVLRHLREEIGFEGLLVSDALDMAGASAGRGIPEAAVLALAAGVDLLCLGPDKDQALVLATQAAIVSAVTAGRITEDRLAEAVDRIAARPRGGGTATAYNEAAQSAGASAALRIEGDLPDLTGAVLVRVEDEPNKAVGVVPWGLPGEVVGPNMAPGWRNRPVVVQARDAHRHPGTIALLEELFGRGPVVLVEYGWPGPLTVPVVRIVTHGGSRPSSGAVERLLRERGWRP
jgi:beta-N-acetylhexosaminidase